MKPTPARSRVQSQSLFAQARQLMPGGVNSPVRAFRSVGGEPLFFAHARGAELTDVDGNVYIDYIGSWGPMILGHAHPEVVAAVQQAATRSASFGAPNATEIAVAQEVLARVPGAERVRMVNSGTEACMSAVRLARGFTGRARFIKFTGCYHGHADSFLIKAGSGALTFGQPDSPGVTPGTAQDTLLAPYNDLGAVEELFARYPEDIAALIIEPVAGNMGCIPPLPGFIEGIRALCTRYGALLIFDEVMTGFRLARGGAQEYLGITADLVTLGKVIGGGMPVGAYAGRAEIMDKVSPAGPVYQAGTLSGNPVAMASGLAQLQLLTPEVYGQLETLGRELEAGLRQAAAQVGAQVQIQRVGSMISIHFSDQPLTGLESAQQQDVARFNRMFHYFLDRGIYLPPSAYETWFLSTAHTDAHLRHTIDTFGQFLARDTED
ncbi:MAG: glutamate-1-semialdehyde 2,1-aminomutase [Bacteroidetes bacterium]|nr:glutamate-1-semialdehyde 2,1-aminomutase [Bacteroidota bacterium]